MDALPFVPAPSSTPITVFVLDDHEIVRRGIIELLQSEPDIRVVGEAGTAEQALLRTAALQPQVAVLDARLPDGTGIDVCRDLHSSSPQTRSIILTSYDDDDAVFAAIMAGASGYVLKDIRGSGLLDAVRAVASGRSLLDPSVTERVLSRVRDGLPGDPRLALLNPREAEILVLISKGMTNRQIGAEMSLAEKTVKNYVSGLLAKLGMASRTQAAVFSAGMRT